MNRPRIAWTCFAVAVALTVPAPEAIRPWIEETRGLAATLFARPIDRLLRGSIPDAPEIAASEIAASEIALDAEIEPAEDGGVPVIWSSSRHDTLILGAGWQQGLRCGQIVASGERFLGFVDRVESHLARVHLAGHRGTRFGVLVRDEAHEIIQRILLEGDGEGRARPRNGRILESRVRGLRAWRPGATGLLVGLVEPDAEGRLAVTVPRASEIGDRVSILDPDQERPLAVAAAPLFAARPGVSLARGASGPGREAFIVPVGGGDGVERGDLVTRAGVICGIVRRVGRSTARVETLDEIGFPTERDAEGRRILRGRVEAGQRPVPAGLACPAAEGGAASDPADEEQGLAVHVFRHQREFVRLVRGQG